MGNGLNGSSGAGEKSTGRKKRGAKEALSSAGAGDVGQFMGFVDERNLIPRCLSYLTQPRTLGLSGPPGCGKSLLVMRLAEGRVLRTIVGTEMSVSDIVGRFVLRDSSMVWQDGILLTAMREGAWLYVDEIVWMPEDCLRVMNPLLDGRRAVFVPQTKEQVDAHPDFRLICSFNPSLSGAPTLPADFLDRMRIVHVEMLSERKETELIISRYGISAKHAQDLVKLAALSRRSSTSSAAGTSAMPHARISTRLVESAAAAIQAGVSFSDAVRDCMLMPAFGTREEDINSFCTAANAAGISLGKSSVGVLTEVVTELRSSVMNIKGK